MFNKNLFQLMDFFQECRRRGESAQLFLETRNFVQFATFSFQISPYNHPSFHPHPRQPQPFQKRKLPSQLRRDQTRLRKFREKTGACDPEPTATPPSPPTARRTATASRKFGTDRQSAEKVTSSPIMQVDGIGEDTRKEKDKEERIEKDEHE